MAVLDTPASEASLRPFAELSRGDVDSAGGQGATLGEFTNAGVPVPPRFVVGAPSYSAFCDEGGLRDRARRLVAAAEQRLVLDAARS